MPIIRRIRPCPTACGVLPGCVGCGFVELRRDLCHTVRAEVFYDNEKFQRHQLGSNQQPSGL